MWGSLGAARSGYDGGAIPHPGAHACVNTGDCGDAGAYTDARDDVRVHARAGAHIGLNAGATGDAKAHADPSAHAIAGADTHG